MPPTPEPDDLRRSLPHTAEGSIDWSQRPFAKHWRRSRLGHWGLVDVLSAFLDLRTPCALTWADDPDHDHTHTLASALEAARRHPERTAWIVGPSRWIVELRPDHVTFEVVRRDPPALTDPNRSVCVQVDRGHPS